MACGSEIVVTPTGGADAGGSDAGGNGPGAGGSVTGGSGPGAGGSSNGGAPGTGGAPTNGGGPSTGGAPPSGGAPGTGGSTPTTACENLCDNVESCFGASCGQAGIDCTSDRGQCLGLCLENATCGELAQLAQGNVPPQYAGCLSDCQNGGQGGGGPGPGAGGGNVGMDCGQCAFQNDCLAGCQGNVACQAWAQCALQCSTPDCFTDCNQQNPNAPYPVVYACACMSCENECETMMDPCNQN